MPNNDKIELLHPIAATDSGYAQHVSQISDLWSLRFVFDEPQTATGIEETPFPSETGPGEKEIGLIC